MTVTARVNTELVLQRIGAALDRAGFEMPCSGWSYSRVKERNDWY